MDPLAPRGSDRAVAPLPTPAGPGVPAVGAWASGLPSRIPSLDGFRAISIVLVLVGHAAGTAHAPRFLDHGEHLGHLGVKVFFVISGFLITHLLLKEAAQTGRISIPGFYARRALRIFPALFAFLATVVVLERLGIVHLLPGDLLHSLTYTMNYHEPRAWTLDHLWSLSVEEQFYLLWPLLLCLAGARRAMAVAAAAVVLVPLTRLFMWHALQIHERQISQHFQAVADSIATGCLLAGAYGWLGTRRRYLAFLSSRWFVVVPLLGVLLPFCMYALRPAWFYVLGTSLTNVAIALSIDRCVRFPSGFTFACLNSRPFVLLGTLSYSLYLWQNPFLNRYASEPMTVFPQNLAFAACAAVACHVLVEKPFLRLRARRVR